ncbi:hypothetical protein ULMS_26640 [Patiriisocius marinistellae]|uniref:Uncharacterized protein n=1 Tax=Patiriisocius marinistellae TaxID=2494560 RepID=A0A5J4G2Z0_9FLAO|nr:hypothetical protein ULMS_26640 [Patiriisocius marinistellae]
MSIDKGAVRNQEIVVEFGVSQILNETNQNTISKVTAQLERIGVQNIAVEKAVNGKVTISYHSTLDAAQVKRMLTLEMSSALYLGSINGNIPLEFPSEDTQNTYKLDVHEIQNSSDTERGLDGTIVQFETKVLRFSTHNVYFSSPEVINLGKDNSDAISYISNRINDIAFQCNAHNNPEVRAGPLS